jgi:hypothetical protein
MIVAITTLLGFIAPVVPALITLFTRKNDQAHERAMADKQLEAAKVNGQIGLATEVARADTEQQRELYRYASGPSGNQRVDALNALVRPYITMIMFHLWLGIETTVLIIGIRSNLSLAEIVALVWDEPTKAIFGAVMGFWFGNRAVKHFTDTSYASMPTVRPVEFKK